MQDFARNDASFNNNRDLDISPGLAMITGANYSSMTGDAVTSKADLAIRPSETESRQMSELIKHANRARTHMSTNHSRGRTEQHSGVGFIEEESSKTLKASAKGAVDLQK